MAPNRSVRGSEVDPIAFSFGLNNLTLPNPSLTPNIIKYSYIRKKSWEFKLLVGLVGLVGLCAIHDVSNILYAVYATYGYVYRDHIYSKMHGMKR